MTLSPDEIRNSTTVTQLRECRRILGGLAEISWDSEDVRDYIRRANVVVEEVYGRLTIADPNLIPRFVLDNLHNRSQELLSVLQSAESAGADVHLNIANVNAQLDNFLSESARLPIIPVSTADDVLEKAAEQFNRTASQAGEDITKAIENARTQFDQLSQQITAKSNEFDSVSAGHKAAFDERSRAFETRIQDLTGQVSLASERIEREVTSIQEIFRQSQGNRVEEFQQAQTTRDEEFHARLDTTVAEIESFRDQAKEILEEVAGASTAGNYAGHRDAERAAADLWRWIAVGAFGFIVLVALIMFVDARLSGEEFSFIWVAARSGVLLGLAAFTGYAVRQSGQHRRREEQMARVASELLLMWPFMNRLPDPDREAVLREITPRYFRGGMPAQNEPDRRSLLRSRRGRSETETEPSNES